GASGIAISFCETEERAYLRDIQKLIGQNIPVEKDHPFPDDGTDKPGIRPGRQQNQASVLNTSRNNNSKAWAANPRSKTNNNSPRKRHQYSEKKQA
ncbi:ATP-dependent helicase, partial [candidate division KSB1 bacterium]|nr:ATP-dependent helicase [candidate division KSB1 bacterium]